MKTMKKTKTKLDPASFLGARTLSALEKIKISGGMQHQVVVHCPQQYQQQVQQQQQQNNMDLSF